MTGRKKLFVAWIIALPLAVSMALFSRVLGNVDRELPGLGILQGFLTFFLVCVFIYWIALAIRFVLRGLFWRVGRRLALSYLLIGVLPFVFFAILLAITGYLIAGVLSQTSFRAERQNQITRLDQWNLEYAHTGSRSSNALSSLEIYDSEDSSGQKLPAWLRNSSFNGLAKRKTETLFVSSRLYHEGKKPRSVVLAQPFNAEWMKSLEGRNGMFVSYSWADKGKKGLHIRGNRGGKDEEGSDYDSDFDMEGPSMDKFMKRGWAFNRIVWGDLSPPLVEWETGTTDSETRQFTLLSNPWTNLLDYYFGAPEYMKVVGGIVAGFATFFAVVYLLAVILAAGLIFSISRAVNRIEKGTRAVERGDFTYKIRMKPRNQLGEVAVSFDRMTDSIAGLLTKVAEKERLQSEIDIAATIQRNLLPKEGPKFRGVLFSAHFEPTASIGGDYYDVFNIDKTRLAVAIGDVSGHGLSTGLVMAMVKAAISTLVEEGAEESALFHRLNDLVLRSTEKRAFMTLGFTIFNLETGTIRHTNAGHLYPYLLRKGERPFAIEVPSLPLGLKHEVTPKTAEVSLHEGDVIVYLSDGIVEARDEDGEPFGFDKLERVLSELHTETPSKIQEAILRAIGMHCGNKPADDDRTVMVLRFDHVGPLAKPGRVLAEELAPASSDL